MEGDATLPARPADRAPRSTVPRPGDRIGRFVLREQLGEGGMGVVFAGEDPDLGRPVAIKLLRAGADAPSYRDRLVREAQALARLDHANVVAVYEVGVDGDRVYVAMELVKGTTLTRWLAERRRSWRDVVAMFLRVGDGLAAVHRAGLVHRDFKPDNVLIDGNGTPRVVDFGLARLTIESGTASPQLAQPLTRTGAVMGTPGYMAPEQQWGADVDARADQYSYCVALRGALTTMAQVITNASTADDQPRGVGERSWAAGVPRPLRRIVDRGLAYDAADRYPTMTELLAALRGVMHGRRARVAVIAAVAVFAAGVVATTIGVAARHDGSPAPERAETAPVATVIAKPDEVPAPVSPSNVEVPAATPPDAAPPVSIRPRRRAPAAPKPPAAAPPPAPSPAPSTGTLPTCRKLAALYCTDDFKATEGGLAGALCKNMTDQVRKWEQMPPVAGAELEKSCQQMFPTSAAAVAERLRQFRSGTGP